MCVKHFFEPEIPILGIDYEGLLARNEYKVIFFYKFAYDCL